MKKKSKNELPEYEKLEIKYKLLQKKYKALNQIKKNLEIELNDIKNCYETFFNSFDEMLFITKPDGSIIFVNKIVSQKLKFSQEELVGKSLLAIIPENKSSEPLENIQEILEGKRDICPIPVISKDGLTIPVETRVFKAKWDGEECIFGISKDLSKLRKVEDNLNVEHSRLSAVIESTGSGIWEWNLKTDEIIYDKRWAEIIGYSLEEISPVSRKTYLRFAHPDDVPLAAAAMEKYFRGETPFYECESRFRHKNGNWIWVLDRGKFYKWDEDGKPILMIGSHQDITIKKEIELSLRKSEEKFRALFEYSPIGIMLANKDGNIIDTNKSAEKILGLSTEEQKKRDIDGTEWKVVRLDGSDFPPEEFASVRALKENKPILNVEMGVLKSKDDFAYISVNAAPIPDIGVVVSFQDITEKINATRTLEENEKILRIIFNISGSGLMIVNSDTREIIDINKTAEEIVGLSKENILGKNCNEFFIYNDFDKNLVSKMTNEFNKFKTEGQLICKDKQIKDILLSIHSFNYKGKESYLLSFMDISEIKKKEKQLRELTEDLLVSRDIIETNLYQKNILVEELSQTKEKLEQSIKEKDRFFSIIAHDLKNPLNGFLGLTRVMAEDIEHLSMKQVQDFSIKLKDSASNLYKLLDNLLEWSRLQREDIKFDPQLLQLKTIVDDIIDLQKDSASFKNIEVINHITDGVIVFADKSMLNMILRNLLSNAIKFTKTNGKAEIGFDKITEPDSTKSFSRIYVKDNGIGMDDILISKLFKLDTKVSRIGTANEPSTGLGLILCKELVEKHGGKIWVESKVNYGSTFYFTILDLREENNSL
jgi:PAS domain S-box-containing protein